MILVFTYNHMKFTTLILLYLDYKKNKDVIQEGLTNLFSFCVYKNCNTWNNCNIFYYMPKTGPDQTWIPTCASCHFGAPSKGLGYIYNYQRAWPGTYGVTHSVTEGPGVLPQNICWIISINRSLFVIPLNSQ